ncbi:hypothetical protein [Microbacterium testaceum]|uniref:hypothetical protein n=1 Tax=Microbacterium testaceum TaxID=2033 RepID=UPI00187CCB4B|nr:hypothetical protein [Microbacterium testaceum]
MTLAPDSVPLTDVPRVAVELRAVPVPDADTGHGEPTSEIVRASVGATKDEWVLLHTSPQGWTRIHDRHCDIRLVEGDSYFIARQLGRAAMTRFARITLLKSDASGRAVLRPSASGDAPMTTRQIQELADEFSAHLRSIMFGARGPASPRGWVLAAILAINTPELRADYRNPSLRRVMASVEVESNHFYQADRWVSSFLELEAPPGLSVAEYLGHPDGLASLSNYESLLHIARVLYENRVVQAADIAKAKEKLR